MTASETRPGTNAAEFPVAWADPDDSKRTWYWDATHFPFPLSVLSVEYTEMALEAWSRLSGRGSEAMRGRFANGFFYFMFQARPPANADQAIPVPAWKVAAKRDAERLNEHWALDLRPRIEALCRSVMSPDFESMTPEQIAGQLRQHFRASAEAFGLIQYTMNALFTALDPFVQWCKARWGAEARDLLGMMIEGVPNETRSSDVALFRIARQAASSPALLKALQRGDLADLRALASPDRQGGDVHDVSHSGVSAHAARVLESLEQYLDKYGWRPEIWFDLSKPTWREDPEPVLQLLRMYAADPKANPVLSGRRAAQRRRRVVRRVERELAASDGGKLDEFRRLYRLALPYVTVREGRALWQLTATGVVRRPVITLGRRLAREGRLQDENDVLHLTLNEIEGLSTLPDSQIAEIAYARRNEHEEWRHVVPPVWIGTFDPAAREQIVDYSGVAGLEAGADTARKVLKGRPASRGVATGRARVIIDLADAPRFERGEVLVCRTTSPAWTPLVARARAVVTDSGGPLAHTAIVAREFAIPCVLAVGDATRRLRDGMMVTVDGGQGIVRIE